MIQWDDPEYIPDLTPLPVIEQVAPRVVSLFGGDQPHRILDPSAGCGAFGSVIRSYWPSCELLQIEPRRDAAESCRSYGEVIVSPLGDCNPGDGFDLVFTNPPFSEWPYFVGRCLELVKPGGKVVFYGLSRWGQSEGGSEVFREYPPFMQLRITGRVSHRGPNAGSDQNNTSWWFWERPRHGEPSTHGGWITSNLPTLPVAARRWVVPPGMMLCEE